MKVASIIVDSLWYVTLFAGLSYLMICGLYVAIMEGRPSDAIAFGSGIIVAMIAVFGGYRYYKLDEKYQALLKEKGENE